MAFLDFRDYQRSEPRKKIHDCPLEMSFIRAKCSNETMMEVLKLVVSEEQALKC